MSFAAELERTETLYSITRDVLAECGNDAEEAKKILNRRLRNDANFRKRFVDATISIGIKTSVGLAVRAERAAVIRCVTMAQDEKRSHDRAGAEALVRGIARSMLDFVMFDGSRLADSTRLQIVRAAEHYEKQSAAEAHRGRFMRAIAQSVPDGAKAGDVISPERANELYAETVNA